MLERVLPRVADNTFKGQPVALWLFGFVLLFRIAMAINSIFNGRNVLPSADGVPLDTFSPQAAQSVVALFALRALSQLIIALLCLLVIVRYRSLTPLMIGVLVFEYLARRVIFRFLPVPRADTAAAGVAINQVLLAILVIALLLALWPARESSPGTRCE